MYGWVPVHFQGGGEGRFSSGSEGHSDGRSLSFSAATTTRPSIPASDSKAGALERCGCSAVRQSRCYLGPSSADRPPPGSSASRERPSFIAARLQQKPAIHGVIDEKLPERKKKKKKKHIPLARLHARRPQMARAPRSREPLDGATSQLPAKMNFIRLI